MTSQQSLICEKIQITVSGYVSTIHALNSNLMSKSQPKFLRLKALVITRSMRSKSDVAEKNSIMFKDRPLVTGSESLSKVPKSSRLVKSDLSTTREA